MSIEFQKPQPLMLGDKAHYTLSSYEPVQIEVEVPATTDEDVEFGLDTMLQRMGGTRADLANGAWVAEHFNGIPDEATLRAVVRAQISDMNAQIAEEQKVALATAALAERLQQSVPPQHLARYRQGVQASFEQQVASEGMTTADFLLRSGASRADLEAMFDAQALQAAEQQAALDAYAREKKLKVDEGEFGRLLGIPAGEVEQVVAQARAAGQYNDLRDAALHAKAAQAVVAECSCAYHHESEDEARARVAEIARMRDAYERGAQAEPKEPKNRGLKLV